MTEPDQGAAAVLAAAFAAHADESMAVANETFPAATETWPEWTGGEVVLCDTPGCVEARRDPGFDGYHVRPCHMLPPEGW